MVAAFGFDQFARVWVLVNLDDAGAATFRAGRCSCGSRGIWVQDGNDVAQTFVIRAHQSLELLLELDLLFQSGVVLQAFQLGQLFLKGSFCCAKFGKSGQI